MKKIIALILSLVMLAAAFAGCGGDKEPAADNGDTSAGDQSTSGGDTTAPDTSGTSETPDPTTLREFDTPEQEALVVVAEAYLARKTYLQYDDTRLVTGSVLPTVKYRWQRHINDPEDCTRQYTGYTNCAAFCYDVYKEAFDLDIVHWNTAALDKATDMQVFHHTITGKETDDEKKAIEAEYRSLLQPGDIINCRHADGSSGHAMLYVGNGQIIHSSAPGGGNYDYGSNIDNIEPRGSIAYRSLDELFTEGQSNYFWTESTYSIVRPLIKYTDAQITEETKIRVEKMQNVYLEKLSSHTMGQTADLNEEITFTFFIRNGRTHTIDLEIIDTIPSNSTYVSGADKVDGDKLIWNVSVASGATLEVSYTVKVNNDASLYDGGFVHSEDATVGGIGVRCQPVYVGKHLSTDEQSAITAAAEKVTAGTLKGVDLAEKIYADAGISIELDDAKTILSDIFKSYNNSMSHYILNTDSSYMSMAVPTMYGGYYVADTDYYYLSERTRGILAVQLSTGDIVMCIEKGVTQSYLYVGNNKVMDLETGKILDLMASRDALMSPLGYDKFVTIRPAAAR